MLVKIDIDRFRNTSTTNIFLYTLELINVEKQKQDRVSTRSKHTDLPTQLAVLIINENVNVIIISNVIRYPALLTDVVLALVTLNRLLRHIQTNRAV